MFLDAQHRRQDTGSLATRPSYYSELSQSRVDVARGRGETNAGGTKNNRRESDSSVVRKRVVQGVRMSSGELAGAGGWRVGGVDRRTGENFEGGSCSENDVKAEEECRKTRERGRDEFAIASAFGGAFRWAGATGPDPVFCLEPRRQPKCRVLNLKPTRLRGLLRVYPWIEVLSIAYPKIVDFE
ncbi:hypothetical protein B0H13DRAFT_1850665 [Mycena leptocephala]|nr:hypothetical protein B0H13DRAFT_1850665 [Mycena leptocephala]